MHVAILDFHERKEFLWMNTNGRHSLQCKEKKKKKKESITQLRAAHVVSPKYVATVD